MGARDQRPVDIIFFNGTVMRGEPDHGNLDGASFVAEAMTAPKYKLYSIGDKYPAMVPADRADGVSVAGELFEVPHEVWPAIRDSEPPGLYRGEVELEDGRVVLGMLGSTDLVAEHGAEISRWGSWQQYIRSRGASDPQHKEPAESSVE